MNQVALELDTPAADAADRTGFDIGWDHAHHALVPPPELLLDGTPICQGWMAGRAVFGRRTMASTRATRQWLLLRTRAWREGVAFEAQRLTAHCVGQLHATHCPVLRTALGGAATQPDAALIERLNPAAAYAAGNLATLSQSAAQAWRGLDWRQLVRRAHDAADVKAAADVNAAGPATPSALSAAAWWRLAALRSYATPLLFAEAATLPLAVLPPKRARLLNAPQGLQALVTLLFTTPGWAARCARLAAMLPQAALRHDFNLFVGAIAPRVLEAGADPRTLHRALEDAWLLERVRRRWQHFVFSLGEAGTEQLLARATADGLAVKRTLSHALEQAVEGWGLPDTGALLRVNTRARPLPASGRQRPPRTAQPRC